MVSGPGPVEPAETTRSDREPVRASVPTGFFMSTEVCHMPNHLTPEELSKELGIDRQEVIRVCLQEGVPIYQGKIDKTLFQAQLQALPAAPSSAA